MLLMNPNHESVTLMKVADLIVIRGVLVLEKFSWFDLRYVKMMVSKTCIQIYGTRRML